MSDTGYVVPPQNDSATANPRPWYDKRIAALEAALEDEQEAHAASRALCELRAPGMAIKLKQAEAEVERQNKMLCKAMELYWDGEEPRWPVMTMDAIRDDLRKRVREEAGDVPTDQQIRDARMDECLMNDREEAGDEGP
jgi:hypothetical protein